MGYRNAQDFASLVEGGGLALSAAIHWHLVANHYPAVPETMAQPCIAAVEAVQDGFFDRLIDLPDGVLYRGQGFATAREIFEGFHLDAFA
jgi:hypothetical protein